MGYRNKLLSFINNSIHQVLTKENLTMEVFGFVILISTDFNDVISPLSPYFWF